MRILWFENHGVFVRIAGRQFLAGHALTAVPSIAAATVALRAGVFDAVLVDYDLDDGKGDEVVAAVRLLDPRPRVIALSAHEAGNVLLLAAGADAACLKTRFAGIDAVLHQTAGRRA